MPTLTEQLHRLALNERKTLDLLEPYMTMNQY